MKTLLVSANLFVLMVQHQPSETRLLRLDGLALERGEQSDPSEKFLPAGHGVVFCCQKFPGLDLCCCPGRGRAHPFGAPPGRFAIVA
jgi:hypothetical protein